MTEQSSKRRDARRVTVGEAAALLGISKDAVRMRIRRGSLRSEKTDNRVYVWLDDDLNADQDAVHHDVGSAYRELIEQLRGEIGAWREEARRKDHIIAGLIERLPPQLEAPPDERESPETSQGYESPGRSEAGRSQERPFTDEERPQEAAQPQGPPRSWWRRMFGG